MKKIYRFYGIDVAMQMLRPGAKWEISNNVFTRWDVPEQLEQQKQEEEELEKALA